MENVKKYRYMKIVTKVSQKKSFSKSLLGIEMKTTKILRNKPVYLGLSILEISKIVMYELWYNYVKPKYEEKLKLQFI